MKVGSRDGRSLARAGTAVFAGLALAAGAVVLVRGWGDGGAAGRPLTRAEAAAAVKAGAVDASGRPLPAVVGDPPDIDPADPGKDLVARAEAATAATPPPSKAKPGEPDPGVPETDPDSLLVSFKKGASNTDINAALRKAGVTGDVVGRSNTVAVSISGKDRGKVTAALEEVATVAKVEPNIIRHAAKAPNDPELPAQQPTLDLVSAPAAWDVANTGAAVTVAVLDTGVDSNHPDLVPNLVAGHDFVNEDPSPDDDDGHGTETAGVIGAATNNGVGVAGIAWNAKIMPVKVLDAHGNGTDADVAQGIYWAVDHGAKVINLSLGGPGATSVLANAVDYALQHNVVVVAAAGNAASQVPSYPAAYGGVVSVSAVDDAGHFAWFSNHGPWVMLSAPGVDVHTTALASGPVPATIDVSGTSFSSPIVAGAAALLLERHPNWTWDTVAWTLIRTSKDAGPAGVDDAYGFGIVDLGAALGAKAIAPTAQPTLAGDAGNFPTTARPIPVGTPSTETLAYEYDEDWFAFDIPKWQTATITVTPPITQTSSIRAQEMDPIVEVYGPGGGLIATSDATFEGEREEAHVDLNPGRHTLRVRNYLGSSAPAPYSVNVTLTAATPNAKWAPYQSVWSTSTDESGVVVDDFTGDDRDDVVLSTGSYGDTEDSNKLFLFTQQNDGSLSGPKKLTSHGHGDDSQITTGDFDGDGDADVALATGSGIDIAWNDGTTLANPTLYAIGPLRVVEAADITAGGPAEVIVGGPDGIRIARWGGDGFVVTPTGIPATGPTIKSAFVVDAGDVTGDGRADLVTAADSAISVYAQQPDGAWAAPITRTFTAWSVLGTADIAVGDISGDQRDDVVAVGGGNGASAKLVSFVQQPDGTLGSPVVMESDDIPDTVKLADVNEDGRDDAVVLHGGWNAVGIYAQTGSGALADEELEGIPYATSYQSSGLSIGDVDSDGINDLAIADYNNGLVVLRHQAGEPAPETTQPWFTGSTPSPHSTNQPTSLHTTVSFGRAIDPSTVNEDTVCLLNGRTGGCVPGAPYLIGQNVEFGPYKPLQPGTPYQLVVWGVQDTMGNGAYATFPFTTAAAGNPTYAVNGTYVPFSVDLLGDGYDDVFWFSPSSTGDPIWFYGPDGKTDLSGAMQGNLVPLAGDFDGNGYDDILWYAPGTTPDIMWVNGPDDIVEKTFKVNGTFTPVVGDFDRNGYDDIVWYAPGTAADSIWKFKAGATYTSSPLTVNRTGLRPAAGDFNKDGYDDVFWHAPGTSAETLWKGGASGFTSAGTATLNSTYTVRAGDVNGDGYSDLVLFDTSKITLLKGGPTGFTGQVGPAVASTTRPVVGELTGDGRDDVLAYVPGTTADKLYRGTATGL